MEIKIVRSARRARTVSAREVDGYLLVQAPATMSDAELQPIVERLTTRFNRRRQRRALDDGDLQRMAQALNKRYFDGALRWRAIRWVSNQETRWGSCTPATGTLRISHRLAAMPSWVLEYVVIHELAHLREANHGPTFWSLVNRYPRTERARGYLMALAGDESDDAM